MTTDDLFRYVQAENQADPATKEAIHPYTDGNGRAGRVLNVLFLIEKQLLSSPVLYLSRYIISNKDKYYDLLLEVTRKQEWTQWVLFMLKAVEETAEWTREKILAITELMESTTKFVQAQLPKLYSKHENLLIYLNIGEYGIRHREIIAAFPDATKDAKDIFKSVWILWKEQAFEVWRDGEPSQRVYGEPGGEPARAWRL